jgi:hypothetical protein
MEQQRVITEQIVSVLKQLKLGHLRRILFASQLLISKQTFMALTFDMAVDLRSDPPVRSHFGG